MGGGGLGVLGFRSLRFWGFRLEGLGGTSGLRSVGSVFCLGLGGCRCTLWGLGHSFPYTAIKPSSLP